MEALAGAGGRAGGPQQAPNATLPATLPACLGSAQLTCTRLSLHSREDPLCLKSFPAPWHLWAPRATGHQPCRVHSPHVCQAELLLAVEQSPNVKRPCWAPGTSRAAQRGAWGKVSRARLCSCLKAVMSWESQETLQCITGVSGLHPGDPPSFRHILSACKVHWTALFTPLCLPGFFLSGPVVASDYVRVCIGLNGRLGRDFGRNLRLAELFSLFSSVSRLQAERCQPAVWPNSARAVLVNWAMSSAEQKSNLFPLLPTFPGP